MRKEPGRRRRKQSTAGKDEHAGEEIEAEDFLRREGGYRGLGGQD